MTNEMVPAKGNPVSLPRLPAWLTSILDADHPDIPWAVPARLPTLADLRGAIGKCDAITEGRATPAFAKQCLGKLLVAFEPNTKLSADDMRMRAAVWLEACGDMNDALWNEATLEAIKALKWMPKPAEFRALVEPRIEMATRHRNRLRAMLEAHGKPSTAKPFVPAPLDVRLRGMRDSYRNIGRTDKAAAYERELARHEKREPEAWATAIIPEATQAQPERPPFVPETSPSAKRCAELARARRNQTETA
jgi:hypothetical protein